MTRYVPLGSKKTPGPVIKVKMVNICMQKKIPKFCAMCKKFKIVIPKVPVLQKICQKHVFFILKNHAKTYQPCHEKQ